MSTRQVKKQPIPPTLEEVQAYVQERNLGINAEDFFDYFDVSGWVDSKGNKVLCWKQKALTWNKHNKGVVSKAVVKNVVSAEDDKELFNLFKKAHEAYIFDKGSALTDYKMLQTYPDWEAAIPNLIPAIEKEIKNRQLKEKLKQFVPQAKYFKNWLKERCWEQEFAVLEDISYKEQVHFSPEAVDRWEKVMKEDQEERESSPDGFCHCDPDEIDDADKIDNKNEFNNKQESEV